MTDDTADGSPWASQRDITVTLTAKEKAVRYYSESTIRHLVATCDGALFWDDRQNLHVLRTDRENGPNDYVCLLLSVEDDGVTVVNQTTDHYDWGSMEHVHPPIGGVGEKPQ